MLVEMLITVGVLLLYGCIAMGIHHWCDREKEEDGANGATNYLPFTDTYGNEYSLIE